MAADDAPPNRDGEPVLWPGGPEHSSALRALVAAQCRVIELPQLGAASTPAAIIAAATARGAARFSVVAESGQAALVLLLALEHPQAVSSVVLLAPTLINAQGQAASPADAALVARLATLQSPLLVLLGTRDTIAPPEAGRHYRERLASCNVVFVYDAGHAMADERPEAVGELVTDFLHRRDLFLVRQQSDLLYR
jgi:pimeloyl-ACP methyl ester carboxylesterase